MRPPWLDSVGVGLRNRSAALLPAERSGERVRPCRGRLPCLGRRRGRARRGRSSADAATHRSTSDRAGDSGDARVSSDGQWGGRMGLDPHGFTHCWTLFSKFFSSFPRGTCSLSVSRPYSSSLGWSLPPVLGCNPKQPDSRTATRRAAAVASRTGLSPSPTLPSKRLGRDGLEDHRTGPLLRSTSRTTGRAISTVGHFPLHSPLLRESWLVFRPPLSDMLKFGGSSWPSRGPHLRPRVSPSDDGVVSALRRTRPRSFRRIGGKTGGGPRRLQLTGELSLGKTGERTLDRPCSPLEATSAICVQRVDDSICNSHYVSRSWLRSSSMREPRDPPCGAQFSVQSIRVDAVFSV